MEIGEIIREKRIIKGYSQEQLGLLCGYKSVGSAKNAVQYWEYGKKYVPVERIRKVAEILEIPLNYLIP